MRAGFRILLITAIFLTAWLVPVKDAIACDCAWMGPFLTVGPRSSLVVRGRVIGYYGKGKESPPAMDLEVLEAFCGENPKSPLRVWGDNGMLCRPYVTLFPVGTEWIFALDGPGSKPDMSSGHAISICGEFWLRVEGEKVKGNIDRPDDRGAVRAIPLAEFRKLFAAEVARGGAPKRASVAFSGELRAGESFERRFGPDLIFRLEPEPLGWTVVVRESGRSEDISRLTPPFHFVPNPRDIVGWHFRNSDNTGPNEAGEKNVNAPGEVRDFIFSPEVGRTLSEPEIKPETIEAVRSYGQGRLRILEYRLNNLVPGKKAGIDSMRFEVELSWPALPPLDSRYLCRPLPAEPPGL